MPAIGDETCKDWPNWLYYLTANIICNPIKWILYNNNIIWFYYNCLVYVHSPLSGTHINFELNRLLICRKAIGRNPCHCSRCQKRLQKCKNHLPCDYWKQNELCDECKESYKCICLECNANDMFCFIYIGHGFGKGHGFLYGTDLKVSVF